MVATGSSTGAATRAAHNEKPRPGDPGGGLVCQAAPAIMARPEPLLDLGFLEFDVLAHDRIILLERSEEHTSELQSLMRISYAVFCLKKKNNNKNSYKSII